MREGRGNTAMIALGLVAAGYLAYRYNVQHLGQGARNLRLKIVSVGLDQTDIVINVKILNPNSESLSVKSFVGEMYVNGQPVADIQMFGDYTARANNQITIPLIARPKAANLFNMLANAFRQGFAKVMFAGTINVNDQPIPIRLNYTTR